jgi:hypothetical protein
MRAHLVSWECVWHPPGVPIPWLDLKYGLAVPVPLLSGRLRSLSKESTEEKERKEKRTNFPERKDRVPHSCFSFFFISKVSRLRLQPWLACFLVHVPFAVIRGCLISLY